MARRTYYMSAKMLVYNIMCIILALVLWSFLSKWQSSRFFPSPADIFRAFVNLTVHGGVEGIRLHTHILVSMSRQFSGFGAACALGIPLGLLTGLYAKVYDRSKIITETVRFISPIAWIPLVIIILEGFLRYVFIIWLAGFFPVFVATMLSIRGLEQIHVDAVRVLGASRLFIIRKIVIPAASPGIATGMRISLGICWACIVAAEMIGGDNVGIGRVILSYGSRLKYAEVIVGMVCIGVMGLIVNEIFIRVEKWLFKWRKEVSIG